MSDQTVAKEVVETLRDLGVKHIFGVPSGGWVDYMEAIRTTDGIEFVLATHEGGAGFMADVTGRLTGVPGVCFGTFGPGATNLATGVGNALLDRSPMIALTDEMAEPMRGRVVQMGIDHQALFRPITKGTTRLTRENVSQQLVQAAEIAVSDRPGPVHIGLPVGMSAQATGHTTQAPVSPAEQPAANEETLSELERLFSAARKPVFAVGLGAAQAGLGARIGDLARKFGVPVVLTPMAKGMISEDHECYAGVFFHALSDVVAETHAEADLVVAIGYDPVEFNFESWMRPECPLANIDIVPVDIDTAEYTVAVDVTGDLAGSVDRLSGIDCPRKEWDLVALGERRAAMFERMRPSNNSFGPCAALDVLRDALPQDGIMACDVGAHTHLIGQKWPTPEFGLQIMTNGWSAMGFGLPAAIAAKLCRPEKPVCCVVGDGGFLMTAGEIATAVREKLPIVILVLTDNDLALIRIKQERKDNPIYGTPVRPDGTIGGPSLFGAPVVTAATPDELRKALEDGFEADGPVIVEALLDSREYDDLVLRKDKP